MGACYSVDLRIKVKDKDAAKNRLRRFVDNTDAHFHEDEFKKEGTDTNTFDGLVKMILGGWKSTSFEKKILPDGTVKYINGFDASYGWESVMMNFFSVLAPFLEDKSNFTIFPDEDYDKAVVKDGKAIWIH